MRMEYEGHGGSKISESGSTVFGRFVEFEELVSEELVLVGFHEDLVDILWLNIYKEIH